MYQIMLGSIDGLNFDAADFLQVRELKTSTRYFYLKHASIYRIMSQLDPEISSCFIQWMIQLFGLVVDRNVFNILAISAGY